MSDYQKVWQGGPQSLSVPNDADPNDYPRELIEELAKLIVATKVHGEFWLTIMKDKTIPLANGHGLHVGAMFRGDHLVRMIFHDQARRIRPTYELEPPNWEEGHTIAGFPGFMQFMDKRCSDENDRRRLVQPETVVGKFESLEVKEFTDNEVRAFVRAFEALSSDSGILTEEDALIVASMAVGDQRSENLIVHLLDMNSLRRAMDLMVEGAPKGYELVDHETEKQKATVAMLRKSLNNLRSKEAKFLIERGEIDERLTAIIAEIADVEAKLNEEHD